MKMRLIDILIYLLLFILVISFPVDLLKLPYFANFLIHIGLRLILLVFYIFKIRQNKIKIKSDKTIKEMLIFLPFFLICFSNIFASLFTGGFTFSSPDVLILVLQILLCFISAILEEIIFRLFIHNSLTKYEPIKRIFLSALIFALCHFINVINVRSVDALISLLLQTCYTFGLGLILGFIYEYTSSLIFVVIIHFAFNMFNDVLYALFGGYSSVLGFILTAVGIAILMSIYGIILYKCKFKNALYK